MTDQETFTREELERALAEKSLKFDTMPCRGKVINPGAEAKGIVDLIRRSRENFEEGKPYIDAYDETWLYRSDGNWGVFGSDDVYGYETPKRPLHKLVREPEWS